MLDTHFSIVCKHGSHARDGRQATAPPPARRTSAPLSSCPPLPTRRALLAGGLGTALLFHTPASSEAARLQSRASSAASVVTFKNDSGRLVKCYWLNYSGDEELFGVLAPGGTVTVDSWATHPWRIVDAQTGAILHEMVADAGEHLVVVPPPPAAVQQQAADLQRQPRGAARAAAEQDFSGFDGVGRAYDSFASAKVMDVALDHLGGVAILSVEGFPMPLAIPVGLTDAAQLFHASAGVEFRRPSTVATWVHSLHASGAQIDRVLLTHVVGSTIYARLVISTPAGTQSSLDARPADCLALALHTGVPLYISRQLAGGQQPGSAESAVGEYVRLQGPRVHSAPDMVPPAVVPSQAGVRGA